MYISSFLLFTLSNDVTLSKAPLSRSPRHGTSDGSFPGDWVAGVTELPQPPSIAPVATHRQALDSSRKLSSNVNAFQLVPDKINPEQLALETATFLAHISINQPPIALSDQPPVPRNDQLCRPNVNDQPPEFPNDNLRRPVNLSVVRPPVPRNDRRPRFLTSRPASTTSMYRQYRQYLPAIVYRLPAIVYRLPAIV